MVTDLSPEEEKPIVWKHFKSAAKGKTEKFFTKAYHLNGNLLNLEITYIPIKQENKIIGVYGIIQEITDKIQLQQALEQKEIEVEKIYDSLKVGIWAFDINNQSVAVCTKGIKDIAEIEPSDILDGTKVWRNYVHEDDLEEYDAMQEQAMAGKPFNYQYRIITPSGKIKWIQDEAIPIFGEDGTFIQTHGIIHDITKDKELLERVNHLLHHDPLTALPNRKMLEAEMAASIEKRGRVCVHLHRFRSFKVYL